MAHAPGLAPRTGAPSILIDGMKIDARDES